MSRTIRINGLPLPAALVRAVECGAWRTPDDRDAWQALFPDDEIVQPMLYPLHQMEGHDSWSGLADPWALGHAGLGIEPGDIDQARAVLIADLGPDRLIALDFRNSETSPAVVALTSGEHSCWRQVAEDIESFMQAIHLTV